MAGPLQSRADRDLMVTVTVTRTLGKVASTQQYGVPVGFLKGLGPRHGCQVNDLFKLPWHRLHVSAIVFWPAAEASLPPRLGAVRPTWAP